ncbi:MAG: hypothetical protein C0432_00720 [Candidatus Puniceispirillum sp.]|nr:hypothetical protein [Candidatus Pelagibacter sp.]MBA4282805.1 hypothetical protein [Candidatus Puniceispirillum sp.]
MINLFYKLAIGFLLLKINALSLIFVDIDVVRHENKDLIRFVEYDTGHHRFQSIRYYQLENDTEVRYELGSSVVLDCIKRKRNFEISFTNINFDTNAVRIHSNNISEEGLVYPKTIQKHHHYVGENLLFWKDNSGVKTAKIIMKRVSRSYGAYQKFKIELLRDDKNEKHLKKFIKDFSTIFNNQKANNDERGILGELATELSMLSFQYYCNDAKMGNNHGFDGVYIDDSDDPEIFITESKCRSESKSASAYLKDQLSLNQIDDQLSKMSKHQALKVLSKQIQKATSKGKVFKLVHRILEGGNSQFAAQEITKKDWLVMRLSKVQGEEFTNILNQLQKMNLNA